MAKAPILSDITNILNSTTILNANWDAIQAAFENTLSLDGSAPNQMNADLDLNSHNLLNIDRVDADNLYINGNKVVDLVAVPTWEGPWATATEYSVNHLVSYEGSSYICLEQHTSGVFSDDLTALKWELFSQKGAAGAGSGDMLAANNLSDVANAATSRANLGLGSVAIENIVGTAKGGTGASDVPTARVNLGVEIGVDVHPYDSKLEDFSNLSLTEGDILYYNGTAITNLGAGTAGQVLKVNSGATAPEWGDLSTPGITKITSVDASGSSAVDLTGFDNTKYTSYLVTIVDLKNGGNGNEVRARISTDGGSTFKSSNYEYAFAQGTSGSAASAAGSTSANFIPITGSATNGTHDVISAVLEVHPSYSGKDTTFLVTSYWPANPRMGRSGGGAQATAGEANAVKIYPSGGSFSHGTITLYGRA